METAKTLLMKLDGVYYVESEDVYYFIDNKDDNNKKIANLFDQSIKLKFSKIISEFENMMKTALMDKQCIFTVYKLYLSEFSFVEKNEDNEKRSHKHVQTIEFASDISVPPIEVGKFQLNKRIEIGFHDGDQGFQKMTTIKTISIVQDIVTFIKNVNCIPILFYDGSIYTICAKMPINVK